MCVCDNLFSLQDVQDTYAANSKQIDIVTAGCTYRGATSLTVHGKVTDFQMWGRALSDEELVKVFFCTLKYNPKCNRY